MRFLDLIYFWFFFWFVCLFHCSIFYHPLQYTAVVDSHRLRDEIRWRLTVSDLSGCHLRCEISMRSSLSVCFLFLGRLSVFNVYLQLWAHDSNFHIYIQPPSPESLTPPLLHPTVPNRKVQYINLCTVKRLFDARPAKRQIPVNISLLSERVVSAHKVTSGRFAAHRGALAL